MKYEDDEETELRWVWMKVPLLVEYNQIFNFFFNF